MAPKAPKPTKALEKSGSSTNPTSSSAVNRSIIYQDIDDPKIEKAELQAIIKKFGWEAEGPQPGWLQYGRRKDTKARLLQFLRMKRSQEVQRLNQSTATAANILAGIIKSYKSVPNKDVTVNTPKRTGNEMILDGNRNRRKSVSNKDISEGTPRIEGHELILSADNFDQSDLRFTIHNVVGDGNCLTRAVAVALWGTSCQNWWSSIKANVRQMWNAAMRDGTFMHELRYMDYLDMQDVNDNDPDEMPELTDQLDPKSDCWCTDAYIQLIADCYDLAIFVWYQPDVDKTDKIEFTKYCGRISEEGHKQQRQIFLLNINNSHFNALIPLVRCTITSKYIERRKYTAFDRRVTQRKPFAPIFGHDENGLMTRLQHFTKELPIPNPARALVVEPKWLQRRGRNRIPDPHRTAQIYDGHAPDSPPSPGTHVDGGGIPSDYLNGPEWARRQSLATTGQDTNTPSTSPTRSRRRPATGSKHPPGTGSKRPATGSKSPSPPESPTDGRASRRKLSDGSPSGPRR
jgi:hypothetical protein